MVIFVLAVFHQHHYHLLQKSRPVIIDITLFCPLNLTFLQLFKSIFPSLFLSTLSLSDQLKFSSLGIPHNNVNWQSSSCTSTFLSVSAFVCVTHSGSPDAGMKMFMQHNNFPLNCIECSPTPEIHKPPSSSLITHHSCTFLKIFFLRC